MTAATGGNCFGMGGNARDPDDDDVVRDAFSGEYCRRSQSEKC